MSKVFNLTDVPTAQLKQYKLIDMTIAVGRHLIQPGEGTDVADDDMTRGHLEHFIKVGALAMNSLPPLYVLEKERMPKRIPAQVEVVVEVPKETSELPDDTEKGIKGKKKEK